MSAQDQADDPKLRLAKETAIELGLTGEIVVSTTQDGSLLEEYGRIFVEGSPPVYRRRFQRLIPPGGY